ncbi:hypothetical protein TRVL_00009 [Trypanosoma vivax]|nr:hypothetical protein TRVL_00009 [Trypanosoma vivax]
MRLNFPGSSVLVGVVDTERACNALGSGGREGDVWVLGWDYTNTHKRLSNSEKRTPLAASAFIPSYERRFLHVLSEAINVAPLDVFHPPHFFGVFSRPPLFFLFANRL